RLTLGDAMDDLTAGRGSHLLPTRLDSYPDWVRDALLQRVALVAARRRHRDQEPATAERIRKSMNDVLLQVVYQTEVLNKAVPNDAEIAQAYERNASALAQLKSVSVQYVSLPDSALAVRL